ncbi:hypothetical protein JST99_04150 [Candidatus Dependentiae bacterium]|nr:hypothetical protein [Candidatus Dependentiae bacterium]MCC7415387.1 hypothetical protein [Campylobacterota bacterium]
MNIFTFIRSYLLVASFIVLPSCAGYRSSLKTHNAESSLDREFCTQEDQKLNEGQQDSAPWVTVWIHGTQPSFEHAPGKRLRHFLQKHANEYFYSERGLHPISAQPKTNRHYAFAHLLNQGDPVRFPAEHFYTFGWSGDLSFKARQAAGATLYQELVSFVHDFKQVHGVAPRLRLITHSHGGNVALNLAQAQEEQRKDLVIDELVLLACPVQEKTCHLVQNSLFKKVYSCYSSLDLLQVLDPQGLYKSNRLKTSVFSKRRFPDSCDNVVQAKIRFNKRAMLHVEFLSDQFVRALPHIITRLETWHPSPANVAKIKQIRIHANTGRLSDLHCSYVLHSQR